MMFGLRNLSSYMPQNSNQNVNVVQSAVMPAAMAEITNTFGRTTLAFNNQYNKILDTLNARRNDLQQTVQSNLAQNPEYTGSRNAGVKLAWQYEKADIEMGGSGSANWSLEEQDEILHSKTGTVSGAEGHHQKNVVDHPEEQANPDNIKFYKSKEEHLQEGHGGNFQNESDAPLLDKNRMLEKTNRKRVLLNEIKGTTISAAIGFGVAFTISAVVELAALGIAAVEADELIVHSLRAGIEGGTISGVVYCSGRMISNLLQEQGVDLLTKTGELVNYAATGAVSILLISAIQFVRLKLNGVNTCDAFKQVGRSAMFSGSMLMVSIIAQGLYGGCAGLIVSTGVGVVVLAVNIASLLHRRTMDERICEYAIEEYKPILLVE